MLRIDGDDMWPLVVRKGFGDSLLVVQDDDICIGNIVTALCNPAVERFGLGDDIENDAGQMF